MPNIEDFWLLCLYHLSFLLYFIVKIIYLGLILIYFWLLDATPHTFIATFARHVVILCGNKDVMVQSRFHERLLRVTLIGNASLFILLKICPLHMVSLTSEISLGEIASGIFESVGNFESIKCNVDTIVSYLQLISIFKCFFFASPTGCQMPIVEYFHIISEWLGEIRWHWWLENGHVFSICHEPREPHNTECFREGLFYTAFFKCVLVGFENLSGF